MLTDLKENTGVYIEHSGAENWMQYKLYEDESINTWLLISSKVPAAAFSWHWMGYESMWGHELAPLNFNKVEACAQKVSLRMTLGWYSSLRIVE